MTSREETVLAPTDGSITDENDWWEFSLTEVKVMKPGKKHYANLLDATEQNPVQVIGSLEPLPETHEHLLLKPDNPPKRIIIDEVTHYAYGQTEDKSIELWVAGKAGWYNVISPAKGFQPTYNRMVQAIDLLYFLVDKHQHGKKQLNPSFRNLCEQYTYHSYGSCETREESAEVFALHAAFLLRCMIQGDADVDWMRTSVFVHLRRQFNDDYNRLMEELLPSPDESEAKDEPEVTTPRHEPAAVSKSQTDAIYRLIRDLKEEGHLAKRRLHLDLLTERLADRFSFSNDDARKIIAIRASEVVELMDDEDDIPGFKWSRYVIHRELTNAASKSAPLPRALLTPLHLADESSDDERFGRTQKSVLRPKVFAVSNKATGKRNRMVPSVQPASEYSDDDEQEDTDEMEDIQNIETPSKVRGHELIRDPLSATKPRARSFLSASSSGAGSSLMKSLFKDKLQTPSISSSTTHKVSSPEPGPTSTQDTPRGSEEPPTYLPGPWACRMPGCTTVFSMPDGDERRQLIGTHAGEHDWETQMKIELMEQEKRMHSSLPVSNLMQYVLDQHVQTMRSAFPEFYTAPKQNGIAEDQDGMGGEESIPETEQPDLEFNEDDQDQDEEDDELEDLANGHS
ncbi:unnamed protein product [Penicillium salamii]|uniref:DNA (cytosine-5)-methyltransferase 1 replication foci domain-containing protein n=1 Tax=Penicillium salamii TaxID=1612424 RepID=A0A9W4N6V8_9EURO|nr:unnamed protein product [Penicillium salamii]CAG8251276.1 unnamed protein product [Penicillium salamii]CAG8274814.1 unnamed protein product [Penicillium salamii]CAG8293393.1 unnamed protein product [Penicillium salamii]CAG8389008.1 unnamed protein product [Penicillium salamii]